MENYCMNTQEAAEYIGIGMNRLRKLAKEGVIPAARDGRHLKFYRPQLEEYAEKQAREGKQL